MQQRRQLNEITVNRELLNGALDTPGWWKFAVFGLLSIVIMGIVVFGYQNMSHENVGGD